MSSIEPCVLVIFGFTGDLSNRKLIPALHNLYLKHSLPDAFRIIGTGRRVLDEAQIKQQVLAATGNKADDNFLHRFTYINGSFDDKKLYLKLQEKLDWYTKELNIDNSRTTYYYSVAPQFFEPITDNLIKVGLAGDRKECDWPKVAFEKPFGNSLSSARKLNDCVRKGFFESQIYRIDHYLAKSAVNNLLVFRFSNSIFEPLLNRNHVDFIQVTLSETLGVEQRAQYYDSAGALRDMVQNHVLQTLALLLMESPKDFTATSIHQEKAKLLQSIVPIDDINADVVRAQYVASKDLPAYIDELKHSSNTETFVAMKLQVRNWRWDQVPIYLRTGKRLAEKKSEIIVHFKEAPCAVFCPIEPQENRLRIRIQPEESISLRFNTRTPQQGLFTEPVEMTFSNKNAFGPNTPEAYEVLLFDLLNSDHTTFAHFSEVESSWQIVQPILDNWEASNSSLLFYPSNSWGPSEANDLLERDGRKWA